MPTLKLKILLIGVCSYVLFANHYQFNTYIQDVSSYQQQQPEQVLVQQQQPQQPQQPVERVQPNSASSLVNSLDDSTDSLAWTCNWSPESTDECTRLLKYRLPKPLQLSKPGKQRWLFFGDSTMKRQLLQSELQKKLIDEPIRQMKELKNPCWSNLECEAELAERCLLEPVYKLEREPNWKPPSWSDNFEGPIHYGFKNQYCSDCSGCETNFVQCRNNSNFNNPGQCKDSETLVYGGFMRMEFARDVELQTTLFQTTQENTVWYLHEHFNANDLAIEWGKPMCVIGIGFHDMILIRVTGAFNVDEFVKNLEWYLNMMKDECSHIIWLSNTAPSRSNPL